MNIIVVTKDGKTYEDCSTFKFLYKKGLAKELIFSCNKGVLGVGINPDSLKDCYDKDTGVHFLNELKTSFSMPECTQELSINQDIFKSLIKRGL